MTPTDIVQSDEANLLDLPVEIRLMILEDLLCHSEPIQARQNCNAAPEGSRCRPKHSWMLCRCQYHYDLWPSQRPHLSVLSTCRQLYLEGTPIFYGQNTFVITAFSLIENAVLHPVDLLGMGSVEQAFRRTPSLRLCTNFRISLYMQSIRIYLNNHRQLPVPTYELCDQLYEHLSEPAILHVRLSPNAEPFKHPNLKSRWQYMLEPFRLLCNHTLFFQGFPTATDTILADLSPHPPIALDIENPLENKPFRDFNRPLHPKTARPARV